MISTIQPTHQAFYLQSMLFNSRSGTHSLAVLDSIFANAADYGGSAWLDHVPPSSVLDELQNLVLQAASLGRYFWPVSKSSKHRGEELRQAFGMTEASPLFDRELRNSMEHFDERLDQYLASDPSGMFMPEYVGPTPAAGGPPLHLFRAYFVDTKTFRLLNNDFAIDPLAQSVAELHETLQRMDDAGGTFGRGRGS